MSWLRAALMLAFSLASVSPMCDQRILSDIQALWNNNPPTGLMEWSVGTLTNVYMTKNLLSAFKLQQDNLTCFLTKVSEDRTSSHDEVLYLDTHAYTTILEYKMVQEQPGVYTEIGSYYRNYMHVLFWKNDVMCNYQCVIDGDYFEDDCVDPYPASLIWVKNYDIQSETQAQDIESARSLLADLKLDYGLVKLNSDCPAS